MQLPGVDRVFDCQRHLVCYQPQEPHFFLGIGIRMLAPEAQTSQTPAHGGDGQLTDRLNAVLLKKRERLGETGLLGDTRDHQRLLILVDPPARRFLQRNVGWLLEDVAVWAQDLITHPVRPFLVNEDAQVVKLHRAPQLTSQHAKHVLRTVVRADGLRDA